MTDTQYLAKQNGRPVYLESSPSGSTISLEMYIGVMLTNSGGSSNESDSGIYLRISTPEAIQEGDMVVFRRETNRRVSHNISVREGSRKRAGNIRRMAMIWRHNNDNILSKWVQTFPPILDLSTLSVKDPQGNFKWVKVAELPENYANDLIIAQNISSPQSRFKWSGMGNLRAEGDVNHSQSPHGNVLTGRCLSFMAFDAVLVRGAAPGERNGVQLARSNRYLWQAYMNWNGAQNNFRVIQREIDVNS